MQIFTKMFDQICLHLYGTLVELLLLLWILSLKGWMGQTEKFKDMSSLFWTHAYIYIYIYVYIYRKNNNQKIYLKVYRSFLNWKDINITNRREQLL